MSSKEKLQKKEYFLEDIVDNSIDLLLCEEDEVKKEFGNIKIEVDFALFSIAVKNLLDNALKFSPDKTVRVVYRDQKIHFINKGEALKYNLHDYFEPFFKAEKAVQNGSFGLGLYIVNYIVNAHGFRLNYSRENEENSFIIEL